MIKKEVHKPRNIDWNDIHNKINRTISLLESGWRVTKEQKENILNERAKLFAAASQKEDKSIHYQSVLLFMLAYETYGIELGFVREVYPLKELTSLPITANYIMGIINVRGQIISVMDIKKFFDLPEKGLTDLNKVIILQSGDLEFGILADSIIGVKDFVLEELQPSLPTLTGIREEYLKGITSDRITVLDGSKLLADKNIVINEEI
ncbi:MAG: chemotaxis protein CheW [Bacteroidota bacterium]